MTKTIEVHFLPGDEVEAISPAAISKTGGGFHKISKVVRSNTGTKYFVDCCSYDFISSDFLPIPKKPRFMIGDVVRSPLGHRLRIRDINKLPDSRDIYLCERMGNSSAMANFFYAEELIAE